MDATKTKRARGTRTGGKGRPEPPWNVILHNSSWHPTSWVIHAPTKTIPGTGVKRATKTMWEAHTKGRAVAKGCHEELAELYEERLREKGL